MSRKWLERESPAWVEKGIITESQAERLLVLYEDKKHAVGILPILGSILVGLGILSFVAANWQDISNLLRFAILVVAMLGFYAVGEHFMRRGDRKLGIALTGIGLATFGAGIFLVGQMLHYVAYDAGSFIIWGSAGVLLTFLYRSRFLFVAAAAILTGAQMYSLFSFGTFSILAFVILTVGLGTYWWLNRNAWLAWLLGLSAMLQSVLLIAEQDLKIVWMLVPALALYALGDWLNRDTGYPLQSSALTAAYLFGCFMVMVPLGRDWERLLPGTNAESIAFLTVATALLAISAIGKWRVGRLATSPEWLLLLPFFYVPGLGNLLYLLALCFFSLYVLWRGYAEEWRFKINLGTVLFLFAVLLAYTRLAWAFMDKSIFFLTGGLLLLALSWYLNRRRRQFLDQEGGERHA